MFGWTRFSRFSMIYTNQWNCLCLVNWYHHGSSRVALQTEIMNYPPLSQLCHQYPKFNLIYFNQLSDFHGRSCASTTSMWWTNANFFLRFFFFSLSFSFSLSLSLSLPFAFLSYSARNRIINDAAVIDLFVAPCIKFKLTHNPWCEGPQLDQRINVERPCSTGVVHGTVQQPTLFSFN